MQDQRPGPGEPLDHLGHHHPGGPLLGGDGAAQHGQVLQRARVAQPRHDDLGAAAGQDRRGGVGAVGLAELGDRVNHDRHERPEPGGVRELLRELRQPDVGHLVDGEEHARDVPPVTGPGGGEVALVVHQVADQPEQRRRHRGAAVPQDHVQRARGGGELPGVDRADARAAHHVAQLGHGEPAQRPQQGHPDRGGGLGVGVDLRRARRTVPGTPRGAGPARRARIPRTGSPTGTPWPCRARRPRRRASARPGPPPPCRTRTPSRPASRSPRSGRRPGGPRPRGTGTRR